jgi:hypothetical protein
VHWLDTEAPPLELLLDGAGPIVRVADGQVPEHATRAEVSLTLPGGSAVTPDHFAIRTGVLAGVLFSVFAEAPGSLTVSQFQVVTDRTPPTPPPPPAEGLCPPTKPGDDCGNKDKDRHFCPSCRSDQPMRVGRASMLEGHPARLVSCETCRTGFARYGGPVRATHRALTLPSFAIPPRANPSDVAMRRAAMGGILNGNGGHAQAIADKPSPLLLVRGISAREIQTLHRAGIITLEQCAALDLDVLAGLLPSGSVTRARLLQGLVRKALRGNGGE